MNFTVTVAVGFLGAFFLGMIIAPIIIKWLKRLRAGQTILEYVTQHSDKTGIPTMGGVIFIICGIGTAIALGIYEGTMAPVFVAIIFAFGMVGFLDDFLKVKRGKNQGLKAYQKILAQSAVAIIAAIYCADSPYIGKSIALPFTENRFDLGVLYIPFAVVTFLAMSNAVNLTDGLDGLAGTTASIYYGGFAVILIIELQNATQNGDTLYVDELKYLIISVAAIIGGVVAFLWFNNHRASVFMGDTGSLALGGGAGALALFSGNPLAGILIGIVYVWSCISVIIQVISFKTTKKRIFLMAPYHHHLELKGHNESQIVGYYGIATAVATIVAIAIQ